VTAVSHASSSSKRKIKETRKENQYKIRKIKEKKNKIVSIQASHNNGWHQYSGYLSEVYNDNITTSNWKDLSCIHR